MRLRSIETTRVLYRSSQFPTPSGLVVESPCHVAHPGLAAESVELRRRVHAGLNKGEARSALDRVVFFNRLGEHGVDFSKI